jgi:hypothetical protein
MSGTAKTIDEENGGSRTISNENKNENIQNDVVISLVDYRTRLYNNFASDALSILSIQLLILPISLSIISLFPQFTDKEPATLFTNHKLYIFGITGTQYVTFAAFFAIVAVLTSVETYYIARKKATNQPNLLLEFIVNKNRTNDESIFTNKTLNNIHKIM